MNCYEPEGRKIAGTANQRYCGSLEGLREAMAEGVILEGWGARISGHARICWWTSEASRG